MFLLRMNLSKLLLFQLNFVQSAGAVFLQRGKTLTPPNECHGYGIKLSDGEAQVLELWGMWSIPSLQLLPGPH